MNSRERVRTALEHRSPDEISIDLGGNQSGIHIKAYKNLIEYLEIKDDNIQTYDFVQQLAVPCEELLPRFQIDTRYIRPEGDMVKIKDFKPQYEGKYVGDYDQFGCFWGNFAGFRKVWKISS